VRGKPKYVRDTLDSTDPKPWVRGISFTGPHLINYSFTEIAASPQLERAWLDK
jgi:hypothetical protein